MEKQSQTNKYGYPSRIGRRFHEEIELIKDKKLENKTAKDRISTEKITNLIVRHKLWKELAKDIIKIKKEEVDQYGLE